MESQRQQITLRRLLVYVTASAFLLAFANAFPYLTLDVMCLVTPYMPALIISGFALIHSPRPGRTVSLLSTAILLALLLVPSVGDRWIDPPTRWELLWQDFVSYGIFAGTGAMIAALIDAELVLGEQVG